MSIRALRDAKLTALLLNSTGMRFKITCFLALHFTYAQAESEPPEATQQVIISGRQSEVEISRDFVAGKIVIDRQRIADSGLQSTGELLKREPSISVGKDGRIGLLGLPGYTQVLVDGMPPQGDAFEVDLTQVERIEIIKSSTAATGPVGIAGTINIVRKKTIRKDSSQLRGSIRTEGGKPGMDGAWSTNGKIADGLVNYSLSMSAMRRLHTTRSNYIQHYNQHGAENSRGYEGETFTPGVIQFFNTRSILAWTRNPEHTFTFSPEFGHSNNSQDSHELRLWRDGRDLSAHQTGIWPRWTYGLPLVWDWKIDSDSSLAIKLNMNHSRMDGRVRRDEYWKSADLRQRVHEQVSEATNYFLNFDFFTETEGGHQITAGTKFVRNESDVAYVDLVDGVPDTSLTVLGPKTASRMSSGQLFLQDEWRINRRWALNLGAAAERRIYKLYEGQASNRMQFNMWSPSAHVSHRVNGNRKRQIRVSVARSYRTPFLDEMLLRPQITPFAPCPNQGLCGVNGIDMADVSGSPQLQPERSLGVNLSYAHGIGRESEFTIELYTRDIIDKIGTEIILTDVAWANVPRYVIRQSNLGSARVRGLNLEARLAGKDITPRLSNLELSGSIGLADSKLSDLPGPDNHVPEQSPWRVKLAGTYSLSALPLKLGFETSYLPEEWIRKSITQRVYESSRRTLNLNASLNVSKDTTLRLHLDNLLAPHKTRIDEYLESNQMLRLSTSSSNHARVVVRFETTL